MGALVLDVAKVNSNVLPNLDKTVDKLKEASNICSQFLRNLPSSFGYKDRIHQIGDRITRYSVNINDVTIKISEKTEKAATIKAKNDSKARSIVSVAAAAGIGAAAGAIIGPKTSIAVAAGAAVGAAVGAASAKKDKNVFQKIGDGFKKAGAKIAKHTTSFVKKVGDGTKKLFKAIGNGIKNTGKKIAEKTTSFVKKVGQGAKDLFKKAGKAIKNTCSKIAGGVTSLCKKIGDGIKNIGKKIADGCKKIAGKVKSFFSDKVLPVLKDIGAGIYKGLRVIGKTLASIGNLVVSLVEGLVSFVEAIVDVGALLVGAVASIGGAIVDVVEGIATGDWKFDKTSAIWKKGIFPFIGQDWTGKAFGAFEKINPLEKYAWNWAKRNGGKGIACKITKGVGYVAGIVILTALTAGGGGAAVSAAQTATSAGASTLSAVGAGASAFVTSATSAVGTSTAIAGLAKFGAETQKGYNSLSEEEKQSGGALGKVVLSSGIKGGVEAATWYVTYGGGAKTLATSSNKALSAVGKAFDGASKTWWKAGMQAGKEYINEGTSAIVTGEYDFEKATTNAIVSAGTSVLYDKTIGNFIKTEDGQHKNIFNNVKAAKAAANQSQTLDIADDVLDSIDDSAVSAAKETVKGTTKESIKKMFNTEYYMNTNIVGKILNIANEAGGKKIVGKGAKDIIKEVMKVPVEPVVEAIV